MSENSVGAIAMLEPNVDEKAIFVVTVRSLSPQYDVYVKLDQEIHDTPREAIAACRRLYVRVTRGWFRDHEPKAIYGVDFDPEKIDTYSQKHMARLWENGGPGDSPSIHASPFGPVVAKVTRFKRSASGWDNEAAAVIFQLPKPDQRALRGQSPVYDLWEERDESLKRSRCSEPQVEEPQTSRALN